MSKITVSIVYAGLELPVVKNEKGEDVTPLKPISDLFGLEWERQRKKVTGSEYLNQYLGVCTVQTYCADGQKRQQNCILVRRVAAFLMCINPESVKAAGNENGAKYLIGKQEEWADALHDWEEIGIAVNVNHVKQQEQTRKQRNAFFHAIGVQARTENPAARKAIGQVVQQMAAELGVAYQPDLTA